MSTVLLMADNPSSLSKLGEIYDHIAFAGVGKFSEFDQLRKVGVRYADVKGYAYSRDDVRASALANAYSQAMGDVFTRELKPLEVEVIVVEVGDPELAGHENNQIYRIQFDGSISDYEGYCVIGGSADELRAASAESLPARACPSGMRFALGRLGARAGQQRTFERSAAESGSLSSGEGENRPQVPTARHR